MERGSWKWPTCRPVVKIHSKCFGLKALSEPNWPLCIRYNSDTNIYSTTASVCNVCGLFPRLCWHELLCFGLSQACSVAEQQCVCGYSVTNQFYYTLPVAVISLPLRHDLWERAFWDSVSTRGRNFSLFNSLNRPGESTSSPIQCALSGISPRIRRLGLEADRSLPSSAKVKKERIYTSTPPLCLRGLHIDNFTFYLCCCNL